MTEFSNIVKVGKMLFQINSFSNRNNQNKNWDQFKKIQRHFYSCKATIRTNVIKWLENSIVPKSPAGSAAPTAVQ